MIELIEEACAAGARLSKANETIGISCRTIQRWHHEDSIKGDGRKKAAQSRTPHNKLTEQERKNVLEIVNSPEFNNLPPSQIVPILADQNQYIASESTFYRILCESNQLTHRGKEKSPTRKRPTPLKAYGPNQLWSWDITYLPAAGRLGHHCQRGILLPLPFYGCF